MNYLLPPFCAGAGVSVRY